MRSSKTRQLLLVGGAGAALLGAGLGAILWANASKEEAPRAEVRFLDFAPSEAEKAKMDELRQGLLPGEPSFAREKIRHRANAKLFMYMAGTSDDDLVVDASLKAMREAYGARTPKREAPDRDVDRVLQKHLHSKTSARVLAALETARVPLMGKEPSPALTASVVELALNAQASVAERQRAIDVLDTLRPDRRSPIVLAAFVNAAGQEPSVAATALLALSHSAKSLAEAPELSAQGRQKALQLTDAADPGVRGMALQVLRSPTVDPAAAVLARRYLKDESSYVRAVGAVTLGEIGDDSDVHLLMDLLTDTGSASVLVPGPRNPDSQLDMTVVLAVGGHQVVGEAVAFSIRALAEKHSTERHGKTGAAVPRLATGGRRSGPAELEETGSRLRAWYATEKSCLPQAPPLSAPPK